eukprot:6185667-Pleurochrysis_carterae.AAC.1
MPSELIEAVLRRNISGDHAKELLDMIKKGDLAAIVSNGLAGDMLAASPMFNKSLPAAEAPGATPEEAEEDATLFSHPIHSISGGGNESLGEEEGEEGQGHEEEEQDADGGKAKKVARRSGRAKVAAAKAASLAPAAAPSATIDITGAATAAAEEPRPKRPYNRTGMFSRNAETAALAR